MENFDNIIEFYKSDENQQIIELFHDEVVNFFKKNRNLNRKENVIIHSVKSRIKDAEHLRDKLIRNQKKGKVIDEFNFFKEINDLIGVRILHLHQGQFISIHNEINKIVSEGRWTFHEEPKAYTWDIDAQKTYEGLGINTEVKESLYTSVHYLIKLNDNSEKPICCEIQVRTLFEEIWGEIDHTINYPHETLSISCKEQIRVLSKLISTGSRLADSIFRSHQDYNENNGNKSINENHIVLKKEELQYSDTALSDKFFPLNNENNILIRIIKNLKIQNWYTSQNPAIDLLSTQQLNELEENQNNQDILFVLGRNIYQAACGNAIKAVEYLKSLENTFARYSDFVAKHLFAGMFYEVYFDSSNNIREKCKTDCIHYLFQLEENTRLTTIIKFIRSEVHLSNKSFIVLPNSIPEFSKIELKTIPVAKKDEFGTRVFNEIISIKINEEEVIGKNVPVENLIMQTDINGLIFSISNIYVIPIYKIIIDNTLENLFIQYPNGLKKI